MIKLLIWCLGKKKWKGTYSKVSLNVCLQTEIIMFLEEEGIIEGVQKRGQKRGAKKGGWLFFCYFASPSFSKGG